jgi:membrane associated rhomboid family serine protease
MIPLRDDNPIRGIPVVTIVLIVACAAAYLWQISLPPDARGEAIAYLGFMPALLFGHATLDGPLWVSPPATIFTSMFLHGGFLHLAGNMLYLWIFGDNVEDRVGHGRFVVFYLLCGAVAALVQAFPDTRSTIPMIGASGAVSGVLGAYVVLYPRANVLVLLPLLVVFYTIRVPAVIVLGLWFAGQLMSSLMADAGSGGVAFMAHVGGFVTGALLIRFFLRERRRARV